MGIAARCFQLCREPLWIRIRANLNETSTAKCDHHPHGNDLAPLLDHLEGCRACQQQLAVAQQDLTTEHAQVAALIAETWSRGRKRARGRGLVRLAYRNEIVVRSAASWERWPLSRSSIKRRFPVLTTTTRSDGTILLTPRLLGRESPRCYRRAILVFSRSRHGGTNVLTD